MELEAFNSDKITCVSSDSSTQKECAKKKKKNSPATRQCDEEEGKLDILEVAVPIKPQLSGKSGIFHKLLSSGAAFELYEIIKILHRFKDR